MVFENPDDYDRIDQMDELVIDDAINKVESGKITVKDVTKGFEFDVIVELSDSDVEVIKAGGKLNYTKRQLTKIYYDWEVKLMYKITLIPGDGIGPEVTAAMKR